MDVFHMIFNGTNLLLLVFVLLVMYGFWRPFFRGEKRTGKVEKYIHPVKGKNSSLTWCVQFEYRDPNGGKKKHCVSKRVYNTINEARKAYPVGKTARIQVYINQDDYRECMILSDGQDSRTAMFYSAVAIIAGFGVAAAYYLVTNQ